MAAGLADKLDRIFKIKTELKHSSGGIFEVTVNGDLVYSKKRTGDFPDDHELIEKIRKLAAAVL